jgi:tetratricopeptide (TPR) repeat protein
MIITVCIFQPAVFINGQPTTTSYTGEPRTIAHDFLDLEKEFGAGNKHYSVIERLINKAIAVITIKKNYSTEEAVQTMAAIDTILREEGFIFKNNLLLSKGIDQKIIDCDNYCAIYIAIAEVLSIPILPVYAPNHSFIRFIFNDGTYINWEPTQGVVQPDAYYIKTLAVPDVSIKQGVYMKNLLRQEFTAVEYNNIGAYLLSGQRYSDSIPYLSAAIKLYPMFSSAYHNRGTAYYATRRLNEALSDLVKANELDPSRAATHNTLGDIYFDMKEYDKALREYTASIKLDPNTFVPYNSIALIMKIMGKEKESQTWLKKSEEIKAKYGR